jgi:HD-like signal output (HDOD) protein
METIKRVLRGVEDFPTLPTIYTALSEVMANPNSTPSDAADIISRDQSSASKILKSANSSIYGFRGKIDSITQAIFYIGFDEVRNLILTLGIMDIFKQTDFPNAFNPVELWKHSIAVGVITRILGVQMNVKNIENYFIAGIVHDIGKLLFFRTIENDYIRTINHALDNSVTIRDAEAEILGVTHTVAGELIAEKWKLPSSIKNAIRHHYTGVVDGRIDKLVACVHLANIIARMFEFGETGDNVVSEPNLEVWKELNLSPDVFTNIYPRIINDYEESLAVFILK